MKKILLHICCAVCASVCIERLKEEGFHIEGYFYNPNIYPFREYRLRKQALDIVGGITGITIHESAYEPVRWFNFCKQYADEPEGGERCRQCFTLRLYETARLKDEMEFDYFTTTLTVSPHKNSRVINEIGTEIGGIKFLTRDFKKKSGFKRTQEFCKENNIYRQDYCGCLYSLNERNKRR